MKPVKRIEIVTSSVVVKKLTEQFDLVGASGYTILPDAKGRGERGDRLNDDLTGLSRNSVILMACEAEQLEQYLAVIRPVLKHYGGVCLVSDALYLKH